MTTTTGHDGTEGQRVYDDDGTNDGADGQTDDDDGDNGADTTGWTIYIYIVPMGRTNILMSK